MKTISPCKAFFIIKTRNRLVWFLRVIYVSHIIVTDGRHVPEDHSLLRIAIEKRRTKTSSLSIRSREKERRSRDEEVTRPSALHT